MASLLLSPIDRLLTEILFEIFMQVQNASSTSSSSSSLLRRWREVGQRLLLDHIVLRNSDLVRFILLFPPKHAPSVQSLTIALEPAGFSTDSNAVHGPNYDAIQRLRLTEAAEPKLWRQLHEMISEMTRLRCFSFKVSGLSPVPRPTITSMLENL